MAKSQDAKKTEKKEPLKTAKEKKAEKREKKPKYSQCCFLHPKYFFILSFIIQY